MKSRQRRNDAIGIEIAPLIDIVFILLIFFVVSSTFIRENVLEIELPPSQSTADAPVDEMIEVVITANNEIRIGERLISAATVATLMVELESRVADANMGRVVVRADAKSRHETVVLVLDAANMLGLTQVSIVTVQAND